MADEVDIALTDNGRYYDINFDSSGDFELTKGLDSALTITFLTDQRADPSEVQLPENRRGWWGDLFYEDEFKIGSKIWLLYQSPNTQLTLNNAKDYARNAFQWLIDQGYADSINVEGSRSLETITLIIQALKNQNITETVFKLWTNTITS